VTDAGRLDLDQHFAGARAVEVDRFDDERLARLVADGGTGLHGCDSITDRDAEPSATVRPLQPCADASMTRRAGPGATFQPARASKGQPCTGAGLNRREWSMKIRYALRAYRGLRLVRRRARLELCRARYRPRPGSITVEAGEQAGNLSTVNGSVNVGAGARAGKLETVNGAVRIDERAVVGFSCDRQWPGRRRRGCHRAGDAETVNGSMTLRRGARIDGHLQNVNGSMTVEGAEVTENCRP
jgi:hypothetical protein